jgi:dephospho-CoA kinase
VPLVLGITGGMATGKSTVLKMLAALGAQTLSADEIAREVLAKNGPAYRQVVECFGPAIVDPQGEIARSALAKLIFDDPEAREDLNQITHPRIISTMKARIGRFRANPPDPNAVLAVEIPLLFECGLEDMVDQVLLVAAEQDVQLGRLTSRGGVGREDALRRVASQMPIEAKIERADRVIWNNGSMDDLERDVSSFWRETRP